MATGSGAGADHNGGGDRGRAKGRIDDARGGAGQRQRGARADVEHGDVARGSRLGRHVGVNDVGIGVDAEVAELDVAGGVGEFKAAALMQDHVSPGPFCPAGDWKYGDDFAVGVFDFRRAQAGHGDAQARQGCRGAQINRSLSADDGFRRTVSHSIALALL